MAELAVQELLRSYQSPYLGAGARAQIAEKLIQLGVPVPPPPPSIAEQAGQSAWDYLSQPPSFEPHPTWTDALPSPNVSIEYFNPPAGYGQQTRPAAAPAVVQPAAAIPAVPQSPIEFLNPPGGAGIPQGMQWGGPEVMPAPQAAAAIPIQPQSPIEFASPPAGYGPTTVGAAPQGQPSTGPGIGEVLDQAWNIPAYRDVRDILTPGLNPIVDVLTTPVLREQAGSNLLDLGQNILGEVLPSAWAPEAEPAAAPAAQPAAGGISPEEQRRLDEERVQRVWGTLTGGGAAAGQQSWSPTDPGIIQGESGGLNIPTGVKKDDGTPGSTATGPAQFTETRWNDLIARYPNMTWKDSKGVMRPFTAADRTNPEAQAAMMPFHRKDDAVAMEGAGLGRPVTDKDLRVAHQVGAGGAMALYGADPKESADAVLNALDPDILASNPQWRGKTVGALIESLATYGGRAGGGASTATAGAANGNVWGAPQTILESAPIDYTGAPEVPTLKGPDYTQADAAFEAARPTAPEMDEGADLLAFLSGAASGAKGAMSLGEALAGAGGGGLASMLSQRQYEQQLEMEHQRNLDAYEMRRAEIQSSRAENRAELEQTNTANFYQHQMDLWKLDLEAQKERQPMAELTSNGIITKFYNKTTGMMETTITPIDSFGLFLQKAAVNAHYAMLLNEQEAGLSGKGRKPTILGATQPNGDPISVLSKNLQPHAAVAWNIMEGFVDPSILAEYGIDLEEIRRTALEKVTEMGLDPTDADVLEQTEQAIFGQIAVQLMNNPGLTAGMLEFFGPLEYGKLE